MNESSFSSNFNFLLYFFELCGIQNFNAIKLNERNVNDRPTLLRFLYMLFRLLGMSAITIIFNFDVYSEETNEVVTSNKLITMAEMGLKCGTFFLLIIGILQSFIATGNFKEIYAKFDQIIVLLQTELQLSIDWKQKQKILCFKFLIFLMVLTACQFGPIGFYEGNELALVVSFIPNFYFFILLIYFTTLVDVCNELLQTIIKTLSEISNKSRQQKFDLKTLKSNNLKRIKLCRKIYNLLHEIGVLINKSFGLTLLVMIFLMVCAATVAGYRFFVSFYENEKNVSSFIGLLCYDFLIIIIF